MVVSHPQTNERYEGHLLEERVVTTPTLSKGTWLNAIAMVMTVAMVKASAIAKTVIALASFMHYAISSHILNQQVKSGDA